MQRYKKKRCSHSELVSESGTVFSPHRRRNKHSPRTIAIFELVNANVAVMKQNRQFYWRHFAFRLCFVVPIHKVRHQCWCFFGRCVLKSVAISGYDTIRACLILPSMYGITRLASSRKIVVNSIVFAKQSAMQSTDKVLSQRLLCFRCLDQHHL